MMSNSFRAALYGIAFCLAFIIGQFLLARLAVQNGFLAKYSCPLVWQVVWRTTAVLTVPKVLLYRVSVIVKSFLVHANVNTC